VTLAATGVLYVIAGATPTCSPYRHFDYAGAGQGLGCLFRTDTGGRSFVDVQFIAQLTGHPVRSEYKDSGAPDVLPPSDAMVVVPATFNTINKCARQGLGSCARYTFTN
jgi:hypothetical protein